MPQALSDAATPAARPIRFVHQGRTVAVAGLPSTTSVLAWLREQAHCTGTKEGCNEGDCGACTVLVGQLQADGQVAYRPINSCIQFLPTLDGKALVKPSAVPAVDWLPASTPAPPARSTRPLRWAPHWASAAAAR